MRAVVHHTEVAGVIQVKIEIDIGNPYAQIENVCLECIDVRQWSDGLPHHQQRNPYEAIEVSHLCGDPQIAT